MDRAHNIATTTLAALNNAEAGAQAISAQFALQDTANNVAENSRNIEDEELQKEDNEEEQYDDDGSEGSLSETTSDDGEESGLMSLHSSSSDRSLRETVLSPSENEEFND